MRVKPLVLPIALLLPLLGTACSSGSSDSDDLSSDDSGILLDQGGNEPGVLAPDASSDVDNTSGGSDNSEPDPEQAPEETPADTSENTPEDPPEETPADTSENTPEDPPEETPGDTSEEEPGPVSSGPTAAELGVPTIVDFSDGRVTGFESVLRQVVSAGIGDLNQKLQSGEAFSDIENTCLGSFDPAIGEALTAIDCGTDRLPLENGVHPLYLHEAEFADTAECNDGLLALDASACQLISAKVTAPVEWVVPDGGRLPRPSPNGIAEFNTEPGTLAIFNIVDVTATPAYDCEFDLNDGSVSSGLTFGNCNGSLDNLTARLRLWLERRANP